MKKYRLGIISLSVILAEFIGFLILGFNMSPGDEMGYAMLAFYIVFPITALILSILLAAKKSVFFFPSALLTMISPIILSEIFFGWQGIDAQDIAMGIYTLVPCAIGGIIGLIINHFKK